MSGIAIEFKFNGKTFNNIFKNKLIFELFFLMLSYLLIVYGGAYCGWYGKQT
jgi:hypothetical protein